jgi:hypothetical protein
LKIDGDDGIVVTVAAKRTRIEPAVRKGPLKGRRVEVASMAGINALGDIVEAFMRAIFGFEPGQYLITDRSSLYDFVGVNDRGAEEIHRKIRRAYGLDLADLRDGNLPQLLKRLQERQVE